MVDEFTEGGQDVVIDDLLEVVQDEDDRTWKLSEPAPEFQHLGGTELVRGGDVAQRASLGYPAAGNERENDVGPGRPEIVVGGVEAEPADGDAGLLRPGPCCDRERLAGSRAGADQG